jgi:hypothetical protein
MAGMYSKEMEREKIPNRANHPWAKLVRDTLKEENPGLYAELESDGDLDAYASIKVSQCMEDIRWYQNPGGNDYATAKELAMADMLTTAETESAEDYEVEGGAEDMMEAIGQWASTRMQDRDEPPDEPYDDEDDPGQESDDED